MSIIERFFTDMKSKKVTFIGMGVSHNDLIKLFLDKGIKTTVCDRKTADQLGDNYDKLSSLGAEFVLGDDYLETILSADVIFRAPGMYFNHPALIKAREHGIVVTSEMEVFFDLCPCKIYAVTGSDGKTTTTSIIADFFTAQGRTVHKGGNIGRALLPIIESISHDDVAVVELSSFQLISMRKSPDVAVITNISPNHLDVHGCMEEYIDSKKNIFLHQTAFSKTILNADNAETDVFSPFVRGNLVKFSRLTTPKIGAYMDKKKNLCYTKFGSVTEIMNADDIKLGGLHNVENYLAAISAVWGEVDIENITRVAKRFNGIEHRMEFVREINGVKWYNDSIATSPTSVIAGLNSFNQRYVLICGGYDKKIPFEPMAETINLKVRVLILLGATADKIQAAVTSCPIYDEKRLCIVRVSSMEDAVQAAYDFAEEDNIVTLSPACASFDSYTNFDARGKHFKDTVNAIQP